MEIKVKVYICILCKNMYFIYNNTANKSLLPFECIGFYTLFIEVEK